MASVVIGCERSATYLKKPCGLVVKVRYNLSYKESQVSSSLLVVGVLLLRYSENTKIKD